MKILLFVTLAAFPFFLGGCSSEHESKDPSSSAAQAEEYYTCPMHPSVRSERPGACPVCGMALVKKTALAEASSSELESLAHVSLSPTQRVLANVSTTSVKRQRFLKEIVVAGVVETAEPRQSTVSARFRGRIEKLFVAFTGEKVQKGQPLFEMYSPDLVSAQQEFLLAVNGASSIAANPDFQTVSGGILSSVRDRLSIHFGMTQHQIRQIEESGKVLSTVTFYSPRGGTVLRKSVFEGQYVDEGMPLYEVADLSLVWIYFDAYEQDLALVQTGQQVRLTTQAFPGREFSGRVTFVDPVLNPETRTVRVRIETRNPDNILKPRMFVTGRIEVLLESALTVPRTAILSTGLKDVVWIEVSENTFEPRWITKGIQAEGNVQVLSGLHEGERVVITGGYLIDSESALQMPASADPHAGHQIGSSSPAREEASNDLFLRVKGSYTPNILRAQKGIPLRLKIYRDEKSACTEEIVFPDFNVRAHLAAFDTTVVEFTPDRAGNFIFSCGMDMVHGTLIVE